MIGNPIPPRIRLLYIDGLRGLAAFGILLHHTHLRMIEALGPASRLAAGPRFLTAAHCLVSLFVVMSGYSLMIPVVRAPDRRLVGGLKEYTHRRMRRILPPYYAALGFSLLPLIPGWIGWPRLPWQNGASENLSGMSIVSHLLLVHNLRADWAVQINAPLWSIASECQLYILFPILLLPIWRRFGSVATIMVGLVLGIFMGQFTAWRGDFCPWYLGVFAMGMTGAFISFGPGQKIQWLWGWIAMTTVGIALILPNPSLPLIDSLVGFASMSMLIRCSMSTGILVQILESRVIVSLGVFSYSLYLVHQPIVTIIATISQWVCGHNNRLLLWSIPVAAIPISLLAALIFHYIFERPFMVGRPKTAIAAEVSAALEPAI